MHSVREQFSKFKFQLVYKIKNYLNKADNFGNEESDTASGMSQKKKKFISSSSFHQSSRSSKEQTSNCDKTSITWYVCGLNNYVSIRTCQNYDTEQAWVLAAT